MHLVVPKIASCAVRDVGSARREAVSGQSSPSPGAPCFFGTGRCDWSPPPVQEVCLWTGGHFPAGAVSAGETPSLTLTSMPGSDGLGVTSFAAMRDIPKRAATSSPYSLAKRS